MSVDARVAAALVFAGAGYYALTLGTIPLGFGDEGYLYYVAWSHLRGRAFYEQIVLHNYLPGLFVPFAGLFAAVGPSVVAARVVMAAGLTLTPVLLYRSVGPLAGRGLALVVALTVLVVPGPWDKFYIPLLNAGLACAGLALVRDGRRGAAFALGFVVGVAWWLRIDAAIAGTGLAACALALRWSTPRLGVPLLTGVAAGFAPGLVMLLAAGALGGYVRQVAAFPLAILGRSTSSENLAPPPLARLGRFDWLGAEAWVFYGSFVVVGAFVLLVVRRVMRARRHPDDRNDAAVLAFAALWVLTNVPQYAFERPDLPHLAQRTGALLLALAVVVHGLWASWRPLALAFAAYAPLLLVVLVVYARGAGGGWRPSAITWHTGPTGIVYPMAHDGRLPPLIDRLGVETSPDELVPVWPFSPGISFVAGRLTPGRHPMVFPDMMTPAVEDELLRDLDGVRVVVYLPNQRIHLNDASAPARFMPRVDAAVRAGYTVSAEAAGVELRRRNAPTERTTTFGASPSK